MRELECVWLYIWSVRRFNMLACLWRNRFAGLWLAVRSCVTIASGHAGYMFEHVPQSHYDVIDLLDCDWLFVCNHRRKACGVRVWTCSPASLWRNRFAGLWLADWSWYVPPSPCLVWKNVLVISHYYSQQVIQCYNIHQFFSICFSENEDSSLVIKEINKDESATNETWVSWLSSHHYDFYIILKNLV